MVFMGLALWSLHFSNKINIQNTLYTVELVIVFSQPLYLCVNVSGLCCIKVLWKKSDFHLLGSQGISFEDQTKHNKPTAPLCFTVVLFVNLFQNTQFTHIILLSFYFSVTVITQIFFLLKSLN